MDSSPEELKENIKKQIVELLTKKLKSGQLTEERSKEIAQFVLEALPDGISYEKLIDVIPKLDDDFHELSAVVVPIMVDYEKKVKETVSAQLSILLNSGKLDEAIDLANKAIEYEKGLT